jgi:plastocyanin
MTIRPRIAPLAAALLILLVAGVPACGKKSTDPGGGGGAKELNSTTLGNGGVYMHTFATAGTYGYHCTVHGVAMSGSVTVGSGGPSASVSILDNSYNPASVSVDVGGTVTWTNNGSNPHTVTSN